MIPYYQDEWVAIYHGDCRELLPELRADVIVSDPPYGINFHETGTSRGGIVWGGIVGDDEPFDPSHLIALSLPTVLFGANHYADKLPSSPSWLVWSKRVEMEPWSQSDAELIWTNLGGPVKDIRYDWPAGVTAVVKDGLRAHPTQKPVGLMILILKRCPEGVVLDPYMGSGTTLRAAKNLDRRCIGIEIEERYCEIAARRCAQEVLHLENV